MRNFGQNVDWVRSVHGYISAHIVQRARGGRAEEDLELTQRTSDATVAQWTGKGRVHGSGGRVFESRWPCIFTYNIFYKILAQGKFLTQGM